MENYTAEELLGIVEELGLPCEIVTDDDQDVSIEVEFEGLDWSIQLGQESPFYHSVVLKAVDVSEEDPHTSANDWNQEHITSTAYALVDPTKGAIRGLSGLIFVTCVAEMCVLARSHLGTMPVFLPDNGLQLRHVSQSRRQHRGPDGSGV